LARDFAKKRLKTPLPENLRFKKTSGSPTDTGGGSFSAKDYIVFDCKLLNPNNSNGFSCFSCAEELTAEGTSEAGRGGILGWWPRAEEIFASVTALDG
jgi:hypothetical protein